MLEYLPFYSQAVRHLFIASQKKKKKKTNLSMTNPPPSHVQESSAPSPEATEAQTPSCPPSPPWPDPAAITAKLRVLACEAKVSRIPFQDGGFEHHRVLIRAISNVLSTDLALFTFAQIIDGLPTADVAWDCRYSNLVGAHPIEQHEDICPGVLERARQFRDNFELNILSFAPQVSQTQPNLPHSCWLCGLVEQFMVIG